MIAITVFPSRTGYQGNMESAIQQNCLQCVERGDHSFCDLPPEALQDLEVVKSSTLCPRGTVLFREGSLPRAAFVLCDGRARITVCSESGRKLTVRIAEAGEVLGLSACLAGGPYQVSAELIDSSKVAVVKRKDLLQFLHSHREACLHVVTLLSQDLHRAYDKVRVVGMGKSRHSHAAGVH